MALEKLDNLNENNFALLSIASVCPDTISYKMFIKDKSGHSKTTEKPTNL